MATLYVPIIVNDELNKIRVNLFAITSKEYSGKKSEFNGREISEFNAKLKKTFSQAFSFDIYEYGKEKKDGVFKNFSGNTLSISLGILCSAYATAHNRQLKEKYDSITVTGNFDVDDNGKICLQDVIYLKEKYNAVQNYASANSGKKHLFLYASSEETIPEGLQENNVLVIRYDGCFSVECVLAEIFEPTDIQKNILKQNINEKYKNEYIETRSFVEWKKELINPECGGFIIEGKSNYGKSIAAANLCKYLVEASSVEELFWITITDNKHFWDKIVAIPEIEISFNKTEAIKRYFPEFRMIDEAVSRKKKSCLVIDNIEGDFVDVILSFLIDSYKTAIKSGLLKVIITSWYKCNDVRLVSELNFTEKHAEEFDIPKYVFESIVYSVLEKRSLLSDFFKNPEKLRRSFLDILYEQCADKNKIFAGYVPIAIAPLQDVELSDLISRYKENDVKSLSPKKRIIRIDFEVLDLISQLFLFAFLGCNDYWHELDCKKLCKILNEKIINTQNLGTHFITEKNISYSINKLISKDFIQNDKKSAYSIKSDVLEYCVFSKSDESEIADELAIARDLLIPTDVKIDYAIQNDLYDEFTKLINQYDDNKKRTNDFVVQCIKYNRTLKYFVHLREKGLVIKENEASPIDFFWLYSDKTDVLKFLIESGLKINKTIPVRGILKNANIFYVSPLFASLCGKNNFEIIKYTLDNNLYEDINKTEFEGVSSLHIYALHGKDSKVLQMLFDYGAYYDKKSQNGLSVINFAILNEKTTLLEYILKNHLFSDIEEKDNYGRTPLQYACIKSHNSENIKLLLEYGANKDVITLKGETLLHLAVWNKDCIALKYILENHLFGDIEVKDNYGRTPLQYACTKSHNSENIKLLLEYGANKDIITSKGETLLHLAARNKDCIALKYILDKHLYSDINERDVNNWTALHFACRCCMNTESIRLLLEYGADKSVLTSDGWALLPLSSMNKNGAILEYILANHYYTNINECGDNRNTALIQAETLKSFKLLLEQGADLNIVTSKGNNILHAAVLFNKDKIVEYILKNLPMVNPMLKNFDGKTPADLAKSDDIKKLFKN